MLQSTQLRVLAGFALAGGFSVFLSGCAMLSQTGAPKPPAGFSEDSTTVADAYAKNNSASLQNYFASGNTKEARNNYIAANLDIINVRYTDFLQSNALQRQGVDTLYDFVTMGLGVAGASLTGTTVKTVLAATTATVSGTKTSIDKNFYYQKTESALVAAMNAARKQALIPILKGMALDLDKYTIGQAVSDLHDYYYAGTYLGAIETVQVDANNSKAAAESQIKILSNVTPAQVTTIAGVTAAIEKLGANDLVGMITVVNNHRDRLTPPGAPTAGTVDALKEQLHNIARNTDPTDAAALAAEFNANNLAK